MKKTVAGFVIGVSVFAIVASSGSASLSGDPLLRKLKSCGTVDFCFTHPSVSAKKINCPSARKIVRKWNRNLDLSEPPARFTRVKNFRCEFKGTVAHVKLRCINGNDTRKRVHADWGD